MSADKRRRPVAFFDTNVLLYLVASDARKAALAEQALQSESDECVISTQVLSEFVNVQRKKTRAPWKDIRENVARIGLLCRIEPVTGEVIAGALDLGEEGGLAWCDAVIVASALAAGADRLLTEDMQAGRRFGRMTIVNPFGEKRHT